MINAHELAAKLRPVNKQRLPDLGDILQYAIPWAALAAEALVLADQVAAWRWLYIGLSTTLLTALSKFLFNFTPLGTRPDGTKDAMPSGHTSSAFMGAGFFHFQFGIEWAIVPYLLAALTGYSRILANRHWPRDVIAGAALAVLINYIFFTYVNIDVPI